MERRESGNVHLEVKTLSTVRRRYFQVSKIFLSLQHLQILGTEPKHLTKYSFDQNDILFLYSLLLLL